jgi:sensor domain CHASE-containing protein
MIKFFRKIRKKMLAENKFSKYLLYAIGEIILVVIGILIALSINNWNERRKESDLKNIYSTRLINDLKKDISTININITRAEKAQSLIMNFTESLDSEISLSERITITEKYFTEGWSMF